MYLSVVFKALFLYMIFEHSEIAILTDCIDVVAVSPELSAPQKGFHLWMVFEHESSGNAFDCLDHF